MTAAPRSGGLRPRRGGHNPRQVRLAIEYTNLMNLASRSDVISVEALDVHPGWPPEKYLVTYRCRGIAGIEADGAPIYGDFHQVKMYLPSDYPLREPHLKWMTPIWHPNIDHEAPNHVCTNTAQNYFAGKPLSDLVRAMGEMVQYVRYHAAWVPPYPLDRAAATWVVEYAEPRGIVSKTHPVDDRPLLRPQRVRLYGAAPSPAAEAGPSSPAASPARAPAAPEPGRHRISLGTFRFETPGRAPGEPEPAFGSPGLPVSATVPGDAKARATGERRGTGGTIVRRISAALERMGLRTGRSTAICSQCSTSLPPGSHFCPHCGVATTQASAACWNCFDASLPPQARFCPRCGAAVRDARPGA